MLWRFQIIDRLIKTFKYSKYLELGVMNCDNNFNNINAELKHGVDMKPVLGCQYTMTTDAFFAQLHPEFMYDLIFIDASHQSTQVSKDIINSLKHLSNNGTIVVHDCIPENEYQQTFNPHESPWTGDSWKSIAELRFTRSDLSIEVVDSDMGCGIIRRATRPNILLDRFDLTWNNFVINKNMLLNIISTDEFLSRYH